MHRLLLTLTFIVMKMTMTINRGYNTAKIANQMFPVTQCHKFQSEFVLSVVKSLNHSHLMQKLTNIEQNATQHFPCLYQTANPLSCQKFTVWLMWFESYHDLKVYIIFCKLTWLATLHALNMVIAVTQLETRNLARDPTLTTLALSFPSSLSKQKLTPTSASLIKEIFLKECFP